MSNDEEANPPTPSKASPAKDHRVKVGFLIVLLIAVVAVLIIQRRGPQQKGWSEDLPAALERARKMNRPLLVFFTSSPMGATTRRMFATTLAQPANKKAIASGRFIRVKVSVDSLKSERAKKYRLKSLPTMLVLDSQGYENNRREGFVGEVPFRRGFLDRKDVQKP